LEILEDRLVPSITALAGTAILRGQSALMASNSLVSTDLGFEHGFSGWRVNRGDTGLVAIVNQWLARGGVDPATGATVAPRMYTPPGNAHHFAVLKTAGPYSVTTLSHPFTVGAGVQQLTLSAFFAAGDYKPFNDYGDIVLYKNATPLVTLFAANIMGGDGMTSHPPAPLLAPLADGTTTRTAVGNFGSTPWTTVQYTITSPGTYLLQARTSNTDDNAFDSYLGMGDVHFVGPPTINVGEPITAPAGSPLALLVTFSDAATGTFKVEVDPGTGTFVPFTDPVYTSGVSNGLNFFEYQKTFDTPGTYNVVFRVHQIDAHGLDLYQDATLVINIFSPDQFANLDGTDTAIVGDTSTTARAGVGGTSLDGSAAHVEATLGSTAGASVFVGSYKSNPTVPAADTSRGVIEVAGAQATPELPTAFFDLRASGVDANSTLATTFTVEVGPGQDVNTSNVYFNDGSRWLPVTADVTRPLIRRLAGLDPVTGQKIVKIGFTATNNSSPSILDLHGTVFTVALPAPQSTPVTTPVSPPVAGLAPPPTAPVTTYFSGESGGTFVLRVSVGTNLSASRAEAASNAANSTTGVTWFSDPSTAAQVLQNALDIQWLLRMLGQGLLGQSGDDNNPLLPALGPDENRVAVPAGTVPAGAQAESQTTQEAVETSALDAMFGGQIHADDVLCPENDWFAG
jgi:hypothetical protein